MGDQLFKAVSKRLQAVARSVDPIARLRGDEFVFLAEEVKVEQDAARIARRIIESFEAPFQFESQLIHISASVGISTFPEDAADAPQLRANRINFLKEKGCKVIQGFYFFRPLAEDKVLQLLLERHEPWGESTCEMQ